MSKSFGVTFQGYFEVVLKNLFKKNELSPSVTLDGSLKSKLDSISSADFCHFKL
jgi:hypothetical protein